MKRCNSYTWNLVLVVALLNGIWVPRSPANTDSATARPEAPSDAVGSRANPQSVSPTNIAEVVQPPSPEKSEAEKWAWWRAMSQKDRFFEYKMPISFYGRVVDEVGLPIAGARIQFTWTDLSREGTSKRETESDASGLFSLTGAVGKSLTVRVGKDGYRHYVSKNRFNFEYAMFADKGYHVPNRTNPVSFVLRRNRELEPLVVRENQEAELTPGQSKSFVIGPDGASLVIERLPDGGKGARAWSARVSVLGGGVALSTEEFPFEAPQSGYEPFLDVTAQTPKPPVWSGDNGAVFFVKSGANYGRITVRNTPGMAWVYVTSYVNPKAGSRNLEYDKSKAVPK